MSKFVLNKSTGELFHLEGSHGGPEFKIDWDKREVFYMGKKVEEVSGRPAAPMKISEPGAEASIQPTVAAANELPYATQNLGRKAIRSMEQPFMAQVRDPHVASREETEASVKNPEFYHQRPSEIARAEMVGKEEDLADPAIKATIRETTVQHLRKEGQPGGGVPVTADYEPARSMEDIADAMKHRESTEVGVTSSQERHSDEILVEGAEEDARHRAKLEKEAKAAEEKDVSPKSETGTAEAADTSKIKEDASQRPAPKADLFSGLKPPKTK